MNALRAAAIAALITVSTVTLISVGCYLTTSNPWWVGALFFGVPALLIRFALAFVASNHDPES